MKLFTILGSATLPLALGVKPADGTNPNCKLNDLGRPDYFAQWGCEMPDGTKGDFQGEAYTTAKCYLECQHGYFPVALQPRKFHRCGWNGWQQPTSRDFMCERDVNELEKELKSMINNVNNDMHKMFRDTMNFNAIRRLKEDNAWLEDPTEDPVTGTFTGPMIVKINGLGSYNNGYVCDTVDQHTADLACAFMGYLDAAAWGVAKPANPDNRPIVVKDITCSSTDTVLDQCTSSGWGRNGCHYENSLWLECNPIPPTIPPTEAPAEAPVPSA